LSTENTTIKTNTTNSITVPGHKPAVLADNVPLAAWRDYTSQMVAHRCQYLPASKLTDPDAKARVSSYAFATLECPIFDVNNNLIGAIFVSWDKPADVPCLKKCHTRPQNMHEIADLTKKASQNIGDWLTNDLKK
jgi:hypothetical protein